MMVRWGTYVWQMLVTRAYKHRLRLTGGQEEWLRGVTGCCRLLYNLALEARSMAWQIGREWVSYQDLTSQLTDLKRDSDYAWLDNPPVDVLRQAFKDLDVAFDRFFRGLASYPQRKRKYAHDSCRFVGERMIRAGEREHAGLVWFSKLGWVGVQNAYPGLKEHGLLHEGELATRSDNQTGSRRVVRVVHVPGGARRA